MADTPRPPDSGEDRDYRRVLSEVMDDQKKRRERAASAVQRANRSNSNALATVAMVCGALSVYVWTNPPAFIEPPPFQQQTMIVTDAAMRSAVAINADKIAAFREANGRLPTSLEEFGAAYPEVTTYTVLAGNLYELRVTEREDTIIYRSDQNLQNLLAGASETLENSAEFREEGGP